MVHRGGTSIRRGRAMAHHAARNRFISRPDPMLPAKPIWPGASVVRKLQSNRHGHAPQILQLP